MNQQIKRELLNSLQLESRGSPKSSTYKPVGILVAITICALGAWVAHSYFFSRPSDSREVVDLATANPEPKPQSSFPTSSSALITETPKPLRFQATGYTIARQSATVSTRTTAVVKSVYVEEGDTVTSGTVLARLDDRLKLAEYELSVSKHVEAQSVVKGIKAQLAIAQRRLERIESLASQHLATESELDEVTSEVEALAAQLVNAKAHVDTALHQTNVHRVELCDYVIRAPFDGVITERSAQPGEIVSPISTGGGFTRTGIATLVNMASLEIEVDINENQIGRVRAQDSVEVRLTAYPDIMFSGRVTNIIPIGDRRKGTVKVRIKLLEYDDRVLPEMGARVDFYGA